MNFVDTLTQKGFPNQIVCKVFFKASKFQVKFSYFLYESFQFNYNIVGTVNFGVNRE